MIEKEFIWIPEIIARVPLYSYKEYKPGNIGQLLKTEIFRNALYLASPAFYEVIAGKNFEIANLTSKEINGLWKYYNRMSFRPTPFGAFASFTVASWSETAKRIRLADIDHAILHLLPSRELQLYLADADARLDDDMLLMLNPTAYLSGRQIRFIGSETNQAGKLIFFLNAITGEALNLRLLEWFTANNITLRTLIELIVQETGSTAEEARDYVDFLIEEELIYHRGRGDIFEADPPGAEVFDPVKLEKSTGKRFAEYGRLKSWPVPELTNLPGEAFKTCNAIGLEKTPEKAIYYGALERPLITGGLDETDQKELFTALNMLQRLLPSTGETALMRFRKAFRERFDQQKVPLLKALDPDTGISFGEISELSLSEGWIRDMEFLTGNSREAVQWTETHRLFLRQWLGNTLRRPDEPVVLTEEMIMALPEEKKLNTSPGMSVMFSRSEAGLTLDMVSTATATSLIGRFSVFNNEVMALARKLAMLESEANPDIIFGDIAQLSDNHIDNINRRCHLFDVELPVNTFSTAETGRKLELRDLMLSLRGDELIIESASTGKRIIPRLTTAFNFTHSELGIFRFLCELQYQGLHANFGLDLERLFPGLEYYPRVIFGNVVLCVAKWHFSSAAITELTAMPLSLGKLHSFRSRHHIPEQVTMGHGDQQLTFNLADDIQAIFFLNCLPAYKDIVLKEFLVPDNSLSIGKHHYSAQYLAFLVKTTPSYRAYQPQPAMDITVNRYFLPGSDWLYLKVYTTAVSSNRLLTDIVVPLVECFDESIHQWFFIRYADPAPHLRLRFNMDTDKIGELLIDLNDRIINGGYTEIIQEYQSEVYRRELERYGPHLIEAIEAVFCAGSELTVQWLNAPPEEDTSIQHWFGLVCAWKMSEVFFTDDDSIESFFEQRAVALRSEYVNSKELKRLFDVKYRELSKDLKSRLEEETNAFLLKLSDGKIFDDFLGQLISLSEKAGNDTWIRQQLIGDLIHMQLNRIFVSNQRQQEALIFHCLYKMVASERARTRGSAKKRES